MFNILLLIVLILSVVTVWICYVKGLFKDMVLRKGIYYFLVSLVLVIILYLLWWVLGYGFFRGIKIPGSNDLLSFVIVVLILGLAKMYARLGRLNIHILWSLLLGCMFVMWFEVNLLNYIFFSTFCFLVLELMRIRLEYAIGFLFGFVFWIRNLDFVLLNDDLMVTLVAPGAKLVGVLCFLLMYTIMRKKELL